METNKIMYSARIQKAINIAIKTHELDEKQKRKGKDIPYITHPLTVGLILSRAGASEDVVIAGLLHDTIEDSKEHKKVTPELIQEMFGIEVADLVLSVTETDKSLSWNERKAAALEHISHFSEGSVLVKSADILSNCTEILADYEVSGDDMFARFNNGKESVLTNYTRVIDALISQWPESPLASDLKAVRPQLVAIGSGVGEEHGQYDVSKELGSDIPKVGDIIYIDSALYIGHGEDDMIGGKARVESVTIHENGMCSITLEGWKNESYGWNSLSSMQEQLKQEFGDSWAHRKPDHRPQFNRGD